MLWLVLYAETGHIEVGAKLLKLITKGIEDDKKKAVDAAVLETVHKLKQEPMLKTKKLGEVMNLEINMYFFCL